MLRNTDFENLSYPYCKKLDGWFSKKRIKLAKLALKMKAVYKTKNKNLMTLEEFKEKNYGKLGTKERDELEEGYESFKIGALSKLPLNPNLSLLL